MWPTDRIDALMSWTLVRAHLLRISLFFQTLEPLGLTPTHFGVLVQLDNSPGVSQGQLARRTLMTPQSMGEALVSLQAAGLVVRGEQPGRGHPIPVSLTEEGRQLLVRATRLVEVMDTPTSWGLTPAEKAEMNTLLHKVVQHATAGQQDRGLPTADDEPDPAR